MIKAGSWEEILSNARNFDGIRHHRDNKAFERFSNFYHWYYFPEDDIFAPSKFIGYKDTKLDQYAGKGNGGETQVVLSNYFTEVPRGTPLQSFLALPEAPHSKSLVVPRYMQ